MTSKLVRAIAGQGAMLVLAGLLFYLAVRNVDFEQVTEALRTANYLWLIPITGALLGSLWVRALRWRLMLASLPEDSFAESKRTPSIGVVFASLVIGYTVNMAAPRLGEIVRSANVTLQSGVRVASVIGTVVSERILDVLSLLVIMVVAAWAIADQPDVLERAVLEPLGHLYSMLNPTIVVIGVISLLLLGIAGFWLIARTSTGSRMKGLLTNFRDGVYSVVASDQKWAIFGLTIAIWVLYWLMVFLPFLMLGMVDVYEISFMDAFLVLTLGTLGMVVPAPGGVGSYHYAIVTSLVVLVGIPDSPALTYAVLTHASQVVVYISLGLGALLLQRTSFRDLAGMMGRRKPVETEA